MKFTRADLLKLLQLIEITQADEIDCTEFMHRAAGFIERLEPDAPAPPGYEELVQHLRICPECLEEFEALYEALRSEE